MLDIDDEKKYRVIENFYYEVCATCPKRGVLDCHLTCADWLARPGKIHYLIDA